jgi:hypothetical protein
MQFATLIKLSIKRLKCKVKGGGKKAYSQMSPAEDQAQTSCRRSGLQRGFSAQPSRGR